MSAEPTARPEPSPQRARRIKTVLLVAAAVLAAADLAIKALAETQLIHAKVIDLGLVNIRLMYNTGVAFSLGAGLPAWILTAASGVIIMTVTWYAVSTAPGTTRLSRAGAALVLGGAAGNFIDRLEGRGVVDYLHTGWFPTFNLADIFVTTGVALYVLGMVFHARPQHGG